MGRKIILQANRKARRTQEDLLGTDLKFPLQVGANGDLATVSGPANVEQSMIDILENMQGEVIFHEDMGGELARGISRTCNQSNADRLAHLAKQQIMQYEARIAEITITGKPVPSDNSSDDNVIRLTSEYTTITYHHEDNFTYDFVLQGSN